MSARHYSMGKVCGCGNAVSNNSASGLCRSCFMTRLTKSPGRGKKISDGLKAYHEDPANHAKHTERARRAAVTKRMNPEWRRKAAQIMRDVVQPLAVASGANRDRDWASMSKKGLEARWAWCPEEYREAYLALRAKGIRKLEARQLIREQIAKDKQRELSKLSPFERQELALSRGGKVVANDRGPSFGEAADYGEAKWERLAG